MMLLPKSRFVRTVMAVVIIFIILNTLVIVTSRLRRYVTRQDSEILKRNGSYRDARLNTKAVDVIVHGTSATDGSISPDIFKGKLPNNLTRGHVEDMTPILDPTRTAAKLIVQGTPDSKNDVDDVEGHIQAHLCPFDPENLIGHLAPMTQHIEPSQLEEYFPDLEDGGRLRPRDCVPRQRLALIIPYRNRWLHLHVMLHNLLPILKRQQADVTIFVIEQDLPGRFNRGALFNIGFLEAEKLGDFDCYIFHDVDLIPLNDYHLYRCDGQPRHFAVYMNKYNYSMPYSNYFGGITGFSRDQYLQLNGHSNLYFGWGGEDDDLYYRTLSQGLKVSRSSANVARYFMFNHSRDVGNEDNPDRMKLLKLSTKRMFGDGLNTCKYQVKQIITHKIYTWISVALNETEVLEPAPAYLLNIKSKNQTPDSGLKARIKPETSTNMTQRLPQEH